MKNLEMVQDNCPVSLDELSFIYNLKWLCLEGNFFLYHLMLAQNCNTVDPHYIVLTV